MAAEENILRIARDIFYQKGFAGARMQEIADAAGINKAMLHYYFKTKDQLFNRVFIHAFEVFAVSIAEILNRDCPLENKITDYVNHITDALQQDPGIPVFILTELTFNPQRIAELFAGKDKLDISLFNKQVKEATNGKTDGETLFADMVALSVYPFIVAPLFKKMLLKSNKQYHDFLENRRQHIISELLKRI